MNYTLFFLPTLFQLGKEKNDDYMRNGQVPEKHEIAVSRECLHEFLTLDIPSSSGRRYTDLSLLQPRKMYPVGLLLCHQEQTLWLVFFALY